VVALSADGGYVKWSLDRPVSPMVGGLAVANGLVYVMSPVEEPTPMVSPPEWALLAIDAETGALRKRIAFPGRALGSPVVADGHVYVPNGNAALAAYGQFPTGALMRLGLPDCAAD
jgi:polyvinyl alcohol dehydrogenase (cytochrome)